MIFSKNVTDILGMRLNVSSDGKFNTLRRIVISIKFHILVSVVSFSILMSGCTSSDDADSLSSDTDSPDTALSGTEWTVISLQRDDGEIIEIPDEANWKARFVSFASIQAEALVLQYNCRGFTVEYVLTGSVFSTDNDPGFADGECVDPGLELGTLEAFVESILTDNVFIFERDDPEVLSLTSGDNEVIHMVKD